MKRLIQVLCWLTIVLMVTAAIGLPSTTDVTPWAWVVVVMGLAQSTLTLIYVNQHTKLAERAALKAEILAEMPT